MIKRFASLLLVFILICSLGISALASTPSDLQPKVTTAEASTESPTATKSEVKPNEKLSAGMRKLLADARAGKFAPAAKSQLEPGKSNKFSTKAKVAIGVVAAVVVIALIVNHERKHFFD
jgi:hypothetical protein